MEYRFLIFASMFVALLMGVLYQTDGYYIPQEKVTNELAMTMFLLVFSFIGAVLYYACYRHEVQKMANQLMVEQHERAHLVKFVDPRPRK